MSDSTLWSIALGVGVLGLLLVVVAGIAAFSANARSRRGRDVPATADPPPQAAPVHGRPVGGGWLWLKAGVFACIHAGAVSFVLGGLTFFEDIARANEEIRTTGTVTFPKRLLPKALTTGDNSTALQLSRAGAETASDDGRQGTDSGSKRGETSSQAVAKPAPAAEIADWEVVEVVPEEAVE
jgi:hypothetical protein